MILIQGEAKQKIHWDMHW